MSFLNYCVEGKINHFHKKSFSSFHPLPYRGGLVLITIFIIVIILFPRRGQPWSPIPGGTQPCSWNKANQLQPGDGGGDNRGGDHCGGDNRGGDNRGGDNRGRGGDDYDGDDFDGNGGISDGEDVANYSF